MGAGTAKNARSIGALAAKLVCRECSGSKHLFDHAGSGFFGRCSYCSRQFSSIPSAVAVADVAHVRLLSLLDDKPPDHARFQDPRTVADVVRKNLPAAKPAFVADLLAALAIGTGPRKLGSRARHLWAFEYDDRAAEERQWDAFRRLLSTGSRFFNTAAKTFLDELFATLPLLTAGGLLEPVRPLRELGEGRLIYRARRANTVEELARIKGNLAAELHAPPPHLTPSSRMNVERIPVFYGAMDVKTAIAETRPSIGSDVVVGTFKTTRKLKVLDFTILSIAGGARFSIWDAEFRQLSVLRALLRRLQSRIAKPVRPGEEHEYIVTQVVADYLSTHLSLDGVMFESAQVQGSNLVIFNAALGPYHAKRGYDTAPITFLRERTALHVVERIEIHAPSKSDRL